jgi:hypothetical protein
MIRMIHFRDIGPPSIGDLGRSAVQLIGERLEDFEAAEPDENHRGPATIGQMLGIIWMKRGAQFPTRIASGLTRRVFAKDIIALRMALLYIAYPAQASVTAS